MKTILITSALPYINGIKHLGNLVGSMLPADIFARYCRMRKAQTLFICATDEHGTPAELAAQENGQGVSTYCAQQYEIQKSLGEAFALSFDYFGRSSAPSNHELTQDFAMALEKNGMLEERISEQVYSETDQRFLPDRYVEGTCPHCEFPRARGDQCDQCSRLLNPRELIEPKSKISGATDLEIRATRHLYLRQSAMAGKLRAWIDECEDWPQLARSIAYKWLDEGLQDRPITRDLSWGIPVVDANGATREGFEDKVYYVWFDAPIAYIAATQDWAKQNGENWQKWWRLDRGADEVEYVQFMGKDNVAFHTISFPSTLIGSGQNWKKVDRLKAFNWLNWYGGKFSTSEKRGVFMNTALDLQPADCWRWWLISNAPENADTQFTFNQFAEGVNKDLADNLGNCVNRISRFCQSKFEGLIPGNAEYGKLEKETEERLRTLLRETEEYFDHMRFRKAASSIRAIWSLTNDYVTQAAPWTQFKTDQDSAASAIRFALHLIKIMAQVAAPIVPKLSADIFAILGEDSAPSFWPEASQPDLLNHLQAAQKLHPSGPLVEKITEGQIAAWSAEFGGREHETRETAP